MNEIKMKKNFGKNNPFYGKHHFDEKGNLKEREKEIENKLNCKFLRIKDYD